MTGSYDFGELFLSIVIAIAASFATIELASRASESRGSAASRYWLAGGTLAVGSGFWGMHFVGMLAYSLPMPVSYDLRITLISLLPAALASALALYSASRERLGWQRLAFTGVAGGTAIAAMQFLGMEAMRMQPVIEYSSLYFSISVMLAIAALAAAVWIGFELRVHTRASAFWKKLAASLAIGATLSGAHYAGMAAAGLAAGSVSSAAALPIDGTLAAATTGGATLAVLLAAMMISGFAAMRPTIRSRLFFLVMGCMMPVSLMALAFVFYDYHHDKEQLVLDTVATARVMTELLDKDLASVESGLLVLATSPLLLANNFSGFYLQSEDVLQNLHANAISLSDANGQQLIDTRRPYGEALPLYDNPTQARGIFETGKPVISGFFISKLNSEPLIAVGVPVRRGDAIVFQVSASLFSNRLSKILALQPRPRDWIVAIYDSTGTIVARSHEMARFVGSKGASAVRARLAEIAEGSVETTTLEGIPVISAFSRSPVTNWTVVIGIPVSSFSGELSNTLSWLLLGLAVLLALSIGLAWRIGSSITGSIHALADPALALGSGARVSVPPLGLVEADEVGRALTKASALLAQAQHDAQHDVLTGLANRALFNEIVRQQLTICKRSAGNLAVLYIDLDGFKAVNDTHGHETGDALLRAVAARIQATIREGDLAARLGGDEFAAILIQPGMEGAASVANKLVESLSIPFPLGALQVVISASIGVGLYPGPAVTTETLLASADEAMYRAKNGGKRRFVMASSAARNA